MLSYHARTLVCIQVRLVTFDVGHVVLPFCIWTLATWVVDVVPASVAVVEVVVTF